MGLFGKTNKLKGMMDVIRCDEPSYLIWKWTPDGERQEKRGNAIRFGSSLRVKDGEVAVFVYHQKDGTMQDYIVGPYDDIIKTANLPILADILGIAYDGESPFQAEVYFINLAKIIQVNFAVPYFDVFDPRFVDHSVPIAVRGTISFSISDYKEFIKLHRLVEFDLDDFQNQIRDAVNRCVKGIVTNIPREKNVPVLQIESQTALINDSVESEIRIRLEEKFGVEVSVVDIGTLDIDKTSAGYNELLRVTREVVTTKVEAETEDYVERIRIQREEAQYSTHKQTQTSNLGAFQVEKQAEIGIAGAEALGKMGENNAGGVDLGGGSVGFNPAAMMVGMLLGSSVGKNLSDALNGTMEMTQSQNQIPPIPSNSESFFIATDGQPKGPFDMLTLKEMYFLGTLKRDSLVWKEGMPQWERAEYVNAISDIWREMPPIPS